MGSIDQDGHSVVAAKPGKLPDRKAERGRRGDVIEDGEPRPGGDARPDGGENAPRLIQRDWQPHLSQLRARLCGAMAQRVAYRAVDARSEEDLVARAERDTGDDCAAPGGGVGDEGVVLRRSPKGVRDGCARGEQVHLELTTKISRRPLLDRPPKLRLGLEGPPCRPPVGPMIDVQDAPPQEERLTRFVPFRPCHRLRRSLLHGAAWVNSAELDKSAPASQEGASFASSGGAGQSPGVLARLCFVSGVHLGCRCDDGAPQPDVAGRVLMAGMPE